MDYQNHGISKETIISFSISTIRENCGISKDFVVNYFLI
jgi:hypothetical protein